MGQCLGNKQVINELNKQRGVQKELLARRGNLINYLDTATSDYKANEQRLKEVEDKIKQLRSK